MDCMMPLISPQSSEHSLNNFKTRVKLWELLGKLKEKCWLLCRLLKGLNQVPGPDIPSGSPVLIFATLSYMLVY